LLYILKGTSYLMKEVTIFTDGACSGNPGPGGWGAILSYNGKTKELSGGAAQTTNNRMELTGVIEALRCLKEPCIVTLTSDSRYVCDGINKGWARSWKRNGWRKADKKPALNSDLWEQLLQLLERHKVTFCWVKGHAGHPENERCDQLAVSESTKYRSQKE
jgi:ribonuclease HI